MTLLNGLFARYESTPGGPAGGGVPGTPATPPGSPPAPGGPPAEPATPPEDPPADPKTYSEEWADDMVGRLASEQQARRAVEKELADLRAGTPPADPPADPPPAEPATATTPEDLKLQEDLRLEREKRTAAETQLQERRLADLKREARDLARKALTSVDGLKLRPEAVDMAVRDFIADGEFKAADRDGKLTLEPSDLKETMPDVAARFLRSRDFLLLTDPASGATPPAPGQQLGSPASPAQPGEKYKPPSYLNRNQRLRAAEQQDRNKGQ